MIKENSSGKTLVIGAGIVGICTALYLQRQGRDVVVVDRNGVGQGCSKGNAGHFATEQVFPLADASLLKQLPGMLLNPSGPVRIRFGYLIKAFPWFVRFILNMKSSRFSANKHALSQLNRKALQAYAPLLSTPELRDMIVYRGSLLTFEKTRDKEVRACFEMYQAEGISVELLSGEEARSLEPALSSSITAALHFKDVAHTPNPERLCKALADTFVASGGQILQQHIRQILPQREQVTIVHETGKAHFEHAIVAAGAWSKRLLAPLGYKLPLDTERGYHLNLQKPNPISRPVASAERKFIITPMEQGLRLAGTVEFAGLDAGMDPKRAEVLYPQANALLNEVPERQTSDDAVWMGMRPSLPDSLPVIGPAPRHPRLIFAFGHQHLGLTQAAITGLLVSEIMAEVQPSIDIGPFCIERFQ